MTNLPHQRFLAFCASMFLFTACIMGQGTTFDSTRFGFYRHIAGHDTLPYRLYRSSAAEQQTDSLPLLVFLHGAGERGNDNRSQLSICVPFFVSDSVSSRFPFLLLCPQCPTDQRWVNTDWRLDSHQMELQPTVQMAGVFDLIDRLVTTGSVDPSRIYIAGISMGGFGVWDALQRRPHTFAAAIAICGGGDPAYAERLINIPIKIFHGERDRLVKPIRSRAMYDAITAAGGRKASLTLYPHLGHLCWNEALSSAGLFDWLFAQQLQ